MAGDVESRGYKNNLCRTALLNMAHDFDYCILGAGLAGLSLADALTDENVSVIVIDKRDVAAGASGTPGALVNPATGRRATKVWKAEECFRAVSNNLQKIAGYSDSRTSFYQNNGLLRPALTKKMARKMKKQYRNTTWPDGWCVWKSESEIKEMHPGINCTEGGLWLPIGLSVNGGKYLSAYADFLQKKGVWLLLQADARTTPDTDGWTVDTGGDVIHADNLLFATGYEITKSRYWDWLPIHPIKGQVAEFELPDGQLPFSHSISSLGYISLVGDNRSFVQGSTYEHDFIDLQTDREGEQYLRKRMRRTLPRLENKVILKRQWAGVRASTPNRKPVAGTHPEFKNLHVYTGLGSKGLMYSKYIADHLTGHLLHSKPLFPEISVRRFDEKRIS